MKLATCLVLGFRVSDIQHIFFKKGEMQIEMAIFTALPNDLSSRSFPALRAPSRCTAGQFCKFTDPAWYNSTSEPTTLLIISRSLSPCFGSTGGLPER